MSRFGGFRSFRAAPKKPPPQHGIKMKKAGTTWWGQRWIEALTQVLGADGNRLARGRTYARAGRAHDLTIQPGEVQARVTGSRALPYAIRIEMPVLSDAAWSKAIASMAMQAQFAAQLLAGEMPADIDEAFRGAGVSLFPTRRAELVMHCSCPDWGDPCKHSAATHYVLGEALDRDPFLLFELRGRTKQWVLDALRQARAEARGSAGRCEPSEPVPAAEPAERPKVAFEPVSPAEYDRAKGDLPALHFSFDAPAAPGALLRQLGLPPGWSNAESPADALGPLVHRAAEAARRIALGEPESGPDSEPAFTTANGAPAIARPSAAQPPERAKRAKRATSPSRLSRQRGPAPRRRKRS